MNKIIPVPSFPYSLTPKNEFYIVTDEKEKPKPGSSGFVDYAGSIETHCIGKTNVPPIISEVSIESSVKTLTLAETAMNPEIGYIRLPRSLLEDPVWRGCPCSYKEVFLILLSKAAYAPYDFNDNSKIVRLEVGEVCLSLDMIKTFCSPDVSRQQIQRSINFFLRSNFAIQRPGHRRSIIKITHPECYDLISRHADTRSDTRPIQDRYIREEDKEDKYKEDIKKKYIKKKSPENPKKAAAKVANPEASKQPFGLLGNVMLSEKEHANLLERFGDAGTAERVENLSLYIAQKNPKYASHYATILAWERKNANEPPKFRPPQKAQCVGFQIENDKNMKPLKLREF